MKGEFITHYPRNGETFMVGHCGANSISSAKDESLVTCEKCLALISGCKKTNSES